VANHLQSPTAKLTLDEGDAQECFVPLCAGGALTPDCRDSEVGDDEYRQQWVWNGRVPVGHVTAIVGPRGAGKSYLMAEIAARVSTGEPWPDDPATRGNPAKVLIISGEDEILTVIKPRLRACGADLGKVHLVDFMHEDGTPGEITAEVIEEMAANLRGLKLIIVDPIADLLGAKNDRRLGELRMLFHKLARLATMRGIGIILVNATDKVSAGKMWQYGVDVLPFLQAGSRAVWTVEEDPGEPGRCLWLPARSNLGAGRPGLAFRIEGEPGKVVWDPEPVALKADELQPVHRRTSKVARAADWLRGYLEERARTSLEVHRDAALEGISRGALHEAKGRVGVVSAKQTDIANGGWEWRLPAWCEPEERGISPQDSKILMQLATALRESCGAEATPGRDEVASPAADAVVGNEACEQTLESPQDSNNSKRFEASGEGGGQDALEVERPSSAREGGIGSPKTKRNAVVPTRAYRDSTEDSNILAELVGAQ